MKSANLLRAGLLFLGQSHALYSQDILVLAGFDRPPDAATVEWMEQQTAQIFSEAGLTFSWEAREQPNTIPAGALAVWIQFHGVCSMEPGASHTAEDGPMAWVQSQGGEILPFIDIDCDRTSAMVWQNRGTLPLPLVVRAFGRALGRVVAHELYHYVTQSPAHTASEIFRHAMTSRDLMLPEVRFEPSEIEALRKGMGPGPTRRAVYGCGRGTAARS